MERDELRTTLVNHLETLRRNLQVVSMEVLKTKYKKPFDALRQDICKAATAYTRFLVFDGMRIKHKYFDEACLLYTSMDNSLLAVRDINHKYIVVERRRYPIATYILTA